MFFPYLPRVARPGPSLRALLLVQGLFWMALGGAQSTLLPLWLAASMSPSELGLVFAGMVPPDAGCDVLGHPFPVVGTTAQSYECDPNYEEPYEYQFEGKPG